MNAKCEMIHVYCKCKKYVSLIDATQNNNYHDKYFTEIDFDLSKALFIFSYNDEDRVNPILKDRMYRIQTQGYEQKEKITTEQLQQQVSEKILIMLKFDIAFV